MNIQNLPQMIYGRDPAYGYTCLYCSSGISSTIKNELSKSANYEKIVTDREDDFDYRYMTVSGCRVLSVFLNYSGTDHVNTRESYGVVSYILSEEDAKDLLNPDKLLPHFCSFAQDAWKSYYEKGLKSACYPAFPMANASGSSVNRNVPSTSLAEEELAILVYSASYSSRNIPSQALFISSDPFGHILSMLKVIPNALRTSTSFHTGIRGFSCIKDVDISMISPEHADMLSTGNSSGFDPSKDRFRYDFSHSNKPYSNLRSDSKASIAKNIIRNTVIAKNHPVFSPFVNNCIKNWDSWFSLMNVHEKDLFPKLLETFDTDSRITKVNPKLDMLKELESAAKDRILKKQLKALMNRYNTLPVQNAPAKTAAKTQTLPGKRHVSDIPVHNAGSCGESPYTTPKSADPHRDQNTSLTHSAMAYSNAPSDEGACNFAFDYDNSDPIPEEPPEYKNQPGEKCEPSRNKQIISVKNVFEYILKYGGPVILALTVCYFLGRYLHHVVILTLERLPASINISLNISNFPTFVRRGVFTLLIGALGFLLGNLSAKFADPKDRGKGKKDSKKNRK